MNLAELIHIVPSEDEKTAFALAEKVLDDPDDSACTLARQLIRSRERLAAWMLANSYATGHGDTISDLLAELEPQHRQWRKMTEI